MFWAASFAPEKNILRPRPQVTLPPLSRLRLLPLLNSHRLDFMIAFAWTLALPVTLPLPGSVSVSFSALHSERHQLEFPFLEHPHNGCRMPHRSGRRASMQWCNGIGEHGERASTQNHRLAKLPALRPSHPSARHHRSSSAVHSACDSATGPSTPQAAYQR
jgi:hypothetical protein